MTLYYGTVLSAPGSGPVQSLGDRQGARMRLYYSNFNLTTNPQLQIGDQVVFAVPAVSEKLFKFEFFTNTSTGTAQLRPFTVLTNGTLLPLAAAQAYTVLNQWTQPTTLQGSGVIFQGGNVYLEVSVAAMPATGLIQAAFTTFHY